jgi:hypothetical protein
MFDIHLPPAGKISQPLLQSAQAVGIDAAKENAIPILSDLAAAVGTFLWRLEGNGVWGASFFFDLDDLRDDFAGFLDHDRVSCANVKAIDLVEIV